MSLVSEVPTLRPPPPRSSERRLPSLPESHTPRNTSQRQDRSMEWLEREIAERDSRIAELLAGGIEGQAVEAEEPG
mgnify:CR=1 FL=1